MEKLLASSNFRRDEQILTEEFTAWHPGRKGESGTWQAQVWAPRYLAIVLREIYQTSQVISRYNYASTLARALQQLRAAATEHERAEVAQVIVTTMALRRLG